MRESHIGAFAAVFEIETGARLASRRSVDRPFRRGHHHRMTRRTRILASVAITVAAGGIVAAVWSIDIDAIMDRRASPTA